MWVLAHRMLCQPEKWKDSQIKKSWASWLCWKQLCAKSFYLLTAGSSIAGTESTGEPLVAWYLDTWSWKSTRITGLLLFFFSFNMKSPVLCEQWDIKGNNVKSHGAVEPIWRNGVKEASRSLSSVNSELNSEGSASSAVWWATVTKSRWDAKSRYQYWWKMLEIQRSLQVR